MKLPFSVPIRVLVVGAVIAATYAALRWCLTSPAAGEAGGADLPVAPRQPDDDPDPDHDDDDDDDDEGEIDDDDEDDDDDDDDDWDGGGFGDGDGPGRGPRSSDSETEDSDDDHETYGDAERSSRRQFLRILRVLRALRGGGPAARPLGTYASRRARRSAPSASPRALHEALSAWDGVERAPPAAVVEKLLLHEFGSRVCVFERVCAQHAQRALQAHARNDAQLDWDALFSHYKTAPAGEKQNYLLSVFLGGMVRSPALCLDLAKRGRSCSAHQHTSSTNATAHAASAPKPRTHHARAPPRPAPRSREAPRHAHDLPRAADRPAQLPRRRQTKQTSSGL